jgi:hypothetical protein
MGGPIYGGKGYGWSWYVHISYEDTDKRFRWVWRMYIGAKDPLTIYITLKYHILPHGGPYIWWEVVCMILICPYIIYGHWQQFLLSFEDVNWGYSKGAHLSPLRFTEMAISIPQLKFPLPLPLLFSRTYKLQAPTSYLRDWHCSCFLFCFV